MRYAFYLYDGDQHAVNAADRFEHLALDVRDSLQTDKPSVIVDHKNNSRRSMEEAREILAKLGWEL